MKSKTKIDLSIYSFGDGSLAYRRAAKRVVAQALEFGILESAFNIEKKTISSEFPKLASQIHWNAPALGFWAWKPLVLKHALNNLSATTKVIGYVDSGCWVNVNTRSTDRLTHYFEVAKSSGGVTFYAGKGCVESTYTKKELINRMKPSNTSLNTTQRAGGIWLLRVDAAEAIVEKWWEFASNFANINNDFDQNIQVENFVAPRNDQSIFSLLVKEAGIPVLEDDLNIHPALKEISSKDLCLPFWAARHRSGSRSMAMDPIHRAIRAIEQTLP